MHETKQNGKIYRIIESLLCEPTIHDIDNILEDIVKNEIQLPIQSDGCDITNDPLTLNIFTSNVKDVSAIFVDITTFLLPRGAGENTRSYR